MKYRVKMLLQAVLYHIFKVGIVHPYKNALGVMRA